MILDSSIALAVAMGRDLPSQPSLATKIAGSKYCNNRFFPPFGKHGQLNLALLDVENCIRWLALRKDNLISSVDSYRPSSVCFGDQGFRVEWQVVTFHVAPHGHHSRHDHHKFILCPDSGTELDG